MMPSPVGMWGLVAVMIALVIEVILRMMRSFSEEKNEWFRFTYLGGCVFFVMLNWQFLWMVVTNIFSDLPGIMVTVMMLLILILTRVSIGGDKKIEYEDLN